MSNSKNKYIFLYIFASTTLKNESVTNVLQRPVEVGAVYTWRALLAADPMLIPGGIRCPRSLPFSSHKDDSTFR